MSDSRSPTIVIFLHHDGVYVKHCQFDMERMRNAAGIDEPKYALQAIAVNHLKKPVLIQAVHLTPEGIEIYVSDPI